MFSILKPFLLNLDPEIAHNLAIRSLKLNYLPNKIFKVEDENLLEIGLLGKKFPNPIGLAAGFDKSAEVYNEILNLGFGFVEVGTITPLKQYGNPKPRIFRLKKDAALINRLGFNNDGIYQTRSRILSNPQKGILGINIGPNKDTKDQKKDFLIGLKNFFNLADYITINISSPNTEGLRDFHEAEKLRDLVSQLNKMKIEKKTNIPLLLKISPDIDEDYINNIVDISISNKISGLIIANTSNKHRGELNDQLKNEEGGLSGQPLQKISNNLIKKFYNLLNGKIPIIGVGGVNSGESAYEKILAGASLLQLYTGMVYKGPMLIKNIKNELIQIIKSEGYSNLKDVIGKGSN